MRGWLRLIFWETMGDNIKCLPIYQLWEFIYRPITNLHTFINLLTADYLHTEELIRGFGRRSGGLAGHLRRIHQHMPIERSQNHAENVTWPLDQARSHGQLCCSNTSWHHLSRINTIHLLFKMHTDPICQALMSVLCFSMTEKNICIFS